MDIKEFKSLSEEIKNDIRFKIIDHYRENTWIINMKHHLYQDRKYRNKIVKEFSQKLNLAGILLIFIKLYKGYYF